MQIQLLQTQYKSNQLNTKLYPKLNFGNHCSDVFVLSSRQNENTPKCNIQKDFIDFIQGKNSRIEQVFLTHDFEQYQKSGIPLKYERDEFVSDINTALQNLDEEEQEIVLSKFNLKRGFDDIDGVAMAGGVNPKTEEEKAIKKLIENFYSRNESNVSDKNIKSAFDTLVKGLPEFSMTIGKRQHRTHIYSVDIHSLIVLQKCMKNPLYQTLSDEDKMVLKLSALMHDFGKRGNVTTSGHAAISKDYVVPILDKYNFPNKVKQRTILHINNHHWFQMYNQGYYSKQDVNNIFSEEGDVKIAQILTKSDFESVKPDFHLRFLIPHRNLKQEEFNVIFQEMMKEIF